jgi:predicted transposase/invertase (TIGR01784 family)
MVPGIDPKVDYVFKRLFGLPANRALSIHLVNAVLQARPAEHLLRVVELELLNPFNDKDRLDDKLSILDIKARDQSGRQFNIEMQLLADRYFRQRVLYYWARLHQSQLLEGEDYHKLRPTLSICFVNTMLFPRSSAYHLVFELRERQQRLLFTDDLVVHILELPKFTKSAAELTTPLDAWLYFLQQGEQLDTEALPPALHAVEEIRGAMGELQMISQSDLERERYEARLKFQRDWSSSLTGAREDGIEQGLEQGRKEGELIGQIHTLERLLRRAETPAAQLLAVPLAELERLAQQLEAALTRSLAQPS